MIRKTSFRPAEPPVARRLWAGLSVVALAVVAYLILRAVRSGGAPEPSWVSYVAVCMAAALAVGSAVRAVRHATGRARGAWRAFGFAGLAWLAGGIVRIAFEPLLGRPTAPSSLADLFYLLSAVPLVAGFAVLARRPRRARTWAHLVLDVWMCAASVFCLIWVAVLAPLYRNAEVPPGFLLLDLSYPISDVLVFSLVVAFLLRTSARARSMVRVVFAAVVVITVSDTAYAVFLLNDSYTAGGLVHLGWIVGYLLVAVAPWIDPPRDPEREQVGSERGEELARVGGLLAAAAAGVAVLALVVTLLVTEPNPAPADAVLLVVGSSVLLTLLIRFAWLLLDNLGLATRLETSEERFRSVVRSDGGIVLVTDLDGRVQYLSGDRTRLYGYGREDVEGALLTDVIHPEDLPEVRESLLRFIRGGSSSSSTRVDSRVRAADGTWRHVQSTVSWHSEKQDRLIVIVRDISDQIALREQLAHLTFHDGLTGLPNRAYFEERAREVLAGQSSTGLTGVAVLFADLDGFTAVNDSVGHVSGDHVLAQAARRLRAAVPPDNTVARFGGDEFAVLVEDHRDGQAVVDLAERLVRALSETFHVADRDMALTASVGIVFGEDGATVSDLLRNADVAMSRAREQGGARVEVFAARMHDDVMRRLELGAKLRQAVEAEQFVIEYQPLVDLGTSRVTGVEALVRWWRDGTLVPPEGFIRSAEESGLIVSIGEWVLREACSQMARWRGSGWHVGLCVNLSPRQVTEPHFIDMVASALADSGLSPGALTLEITEDVLVDDAAGTVERLCELRQLGVRLAIDDFGTGYASLAYLRQLPVDTLKIDPTFVSGLGNDEVLTMLTRTVVRLGHDLGLLVVAEGIERPQQLELLREMECPRGQGYLVARPVAARGVESLLRTGMNATPAEAMEVPSPSVMPIR